MKKFYLFFAGAMLMSLPVMSQRPASGPDDPKLIFTQDFEPSSDTLTAAQAWKEWQETPVDSITELYYYALTGNASVSGKDIYDGSADYKLGVLRTDSVLILLNGVVTTDDAADISGGYYNNDVYSIRADGNSSERAQAFEKFAEDGGEYFFRYTSADATGAGNYSSGVVPNYRRNLFVRGLNIEDNSSYRLTFFVKSKQLAGTGPSLYADVMRGYFHSEKPFSMGLGSSSGTFEYNKTSFTGEWEKVTFMTYYLNDSIADGFVYANGYWWYNDWTYKANDREYNYIKQPDKFFVRLSFASDSTEFDVDNITLTKSWIGGVEHYDNMIRVDFGYETDLKEKAKAALSETGIAAVELPGQYFSVYGYYGKGNNIGWYPIEIASAEYHDDGYMYMWSKDAAKGVKNPFTSYDSVLVSFINPVNDDKIALKYNGKSYPCALDTAWVNAGKTVKNFNNELSRLNPNIVKDKFGKPVYSMKQLPPVMSNPPYENGSFGLQSFDEITVGMSREIEFDNSGETSLLAFLRVTKSGFKEIWKVKEVTDSTATFARQAADISAHGNLSGSFLFEFVNLKGAATDYRQPNPTLNYEFGDIDTNPDPNPQPIFQSHFADGAHANEQCVPEGMIIWDGNTAFASGKGYKTGTKSRMYPTVASEANGNSKIGFYLSARGSEFGGHMYYGYGVSENSDTLTLHLDPGSYSLNFRAANWDGYDPPVPMSVYVFPRSASSNPQLSPVADADKIVLGTFIPSIKAASSAIQSKTEAERVWDNEPFSFSFTVTKSDYYVIEWYAAKGESGNAEKYGGMLMSEFNITPALSLSYAYVIKLNQAVADAEAKLAFADDGEDDRYLGADRDAFEEVINTYKTWQNTAPSKYDEATATVKAAIAKMQLRIDTVNLYYTTESKAIDKLEEFDDDTVGYRDLEAYIALEDLVDANAFYDCSQLTTPEITADIQAYEDAIKALDARVELMGKFADKLAEVDAALKAANAHKEYAEYAILSRTYNAALTYNQITPTDSAYTAEYNIVSEALNNYLFKVDAYEAGTKQIKELYALADTLGYDFGGDKASFKAIVDALQDNDAELSELLREAVILQLYKKLATRESDTLEIDVTPLVPNYYMATEATIDDFRKNSSGKYVIKSATNTTAIPGWVVTFEGAYNSSGAWYPGKEAMDWSLNAHKFIAGVHFENNTKGTATVTIPGLPAAIYNATIELSQNNLSNSKMNAVTDSSAVEVKGSKSTSRKVYTLENIWVSKGSNLTLSYAITGASGSGHVDVTSAGLMLFSADSTANYADLIVDQEAKVADLLTFADAPAEAVSVQFFNLSGVQIDAIKAGEIVIRRTVLSNGKAIVEKILVK